MPLGVGFALKDMSGVPAGSNSPFRTPIEEIESRCARLTAGQLDCLRLVDQHLSSKENAN
ncbi:MAG: hypothetical protein ACJ8FC_03025 [Sphingomicrobium sp.]